MVCILTCPDNVTTSLEGHPLDSSSIKKPMVRTSRLTQSKPAIARVRRADTNRGGLCGLVCDKRKFQQRASAVLGVDLEGRIVGALQVVAESLIVKALHLCDSSLVVVGPAFKVQFNHLVARHNLFDEDTVTTVPSSHADAVIADDASAVPVTGTRVLSGTEIVHVGATIGACEASLGNFKHSIDLIAEEAPADGAFDPDQILALVAPHGLCVDPSCFAAWLGDAASDLVSNDWTPHAIAAFQSFAEVSSYKFLLRPKTSYW